MSSFWEIPSITTQVLVPYSHFDNYGTKSFKSKQHESAIYLYKTIELAKCQITSVHSYLFAFCLQMSSQLMC